MMNTNFKTFFRTYCAIAAGICLLAIIQTQQQTEAFLKIRTRYKWAILMVVFALNAAAGIYLILKRDIPDSFWERFEFKQWPTIPGRLLGLVLVLLPIPILWAVRYDYFGHGGEAFFRLMWLYWWLALGQAAGFKLITGYSWSLSFIFALLLVGVVSQTYVAFLPVTNYPFSVGWSEASRFYYGSLVFSKSLYGVSLPLSVWHGTRYFLLSIPFLIHGLPLWVDRLWQVLLWLGISGLTSWALVRRLKLQEWTTALILAGWFFLYLFQGAVYYHLQVCVILILVGVSQKHPWRSLVVIIAASFWAGMSRLNWFPVPAMLAITLYLLEEPFSRYGQVWRYINKPVLWGVVGLVTALLGEAFYIAISGNTDLKAFGSSLTSALLWYRWFPSDTNPIGIIPGTLIVSIPLLALIYLSARRHLNQLHPLRWFGLIVFTIILLAGGLVVSTKIGGGGDLHNMDAYMVLLALIGVYFLTQHVETETNATPRFDTVTWPILILMLIVPIGFSISRIAPPFTYNPVNVAEDLHVLRETVQSYSKSGEVLFINERHLLTFGLIPNVPVVPEDEVVSLMEMAISGNKQYLTKFYTDLASHRFAAIVAQRQNLGTTTGDFIEESNVWNSLVGQPLLCQYKPVVTLTFSNLQIYIPRAKPCPDFPPSLVTH
jgi:hypothetical protein